MLPHPHRLIVALVARRPAPLPPLPSSPPLILRWRGIWRRAIGKGALVTIEVVVVGDVHGSPPHVYSLGSGLVRLPVKVLDWNTGFQEFLIQLRWL